MHLMSYNITPRPSPTPSFRADEGPLRTGGSGVTNGQPCDGTRRPVTFQVLHHQFRFSRQLFRFVLFELRRIEVFGAL